MPDQVGTPVGVRRPLLPLWPFLLVAVYAVALSLVAVPPVGPWAGLAVPLAVAIALPALLARYLPVVAALWSVLVNVGLAVAVGTLPRDLVSAPWFLNVAPPQLAAAYVLGLTLPARAAAAGIATIAAGGAAFVVATQRYSPPPAELLAWTAVLATAGLLGARQKDGHLRTQRALAHREQTRVQEERERIARELHDVVAHHMSVIAVRSVSASRRIPALPAAAVAEFDDLGTAAREALFELRQMLGVLRGDDGAELEPQPGLADLPRIAERTCAAGTPVELSVAAPTAVPAATAVSAFRIVQEALSNVTRHATGARTRVRVAGEGEAVLVIEVTNDPPPAPVRPAAGGGSGLAGMRERARLLGGTFTAGPTGTGGFAVRAELPLGTGR